MSKREPTDVEIRVAAGGGVRPLRFTWRQAWHTVAQIGRTWVDEEGEHWLVAADYPNLLVELVHTSKGTWLATQKAAHPRVV